MSFGIEHYFLYNYDNNHNNNMAKKRLKGAVVSDKMEKTVVVKVQRIKKHPKYLKRFAVHKKYKAHDEKEECKIGETVIIEECRPISKDKKWRIVETIPATGPSFASSSTKATEDKKATEGEAKSKKDKKTIKTGATSG